KLAALRNPPSGINRIELVLGGHGADSTYTNLARLFQLPGNAGAARLQQAFMVLKQATGAEAIQLWSDQPPTATLWFPLVQLLAGQGWKISIATGTNLEAFAALPPQLLDKVDALYLQCYGANMDNDPGDWIAALGPLPVYPVLWGNTDTTATALAKLRRWRQEWDLNGAGLWLNGYLPDDAGKWAGALACSLDTYASLRVVNKNSGKSLELANGGMTNSTIIGQAAWQNDDNQRWMLVPTDKGEHFKLMSWVNGRVASVAFDSSLIGVPLWTWEDNNDPSQQYDLVDACNGWFQLQNVRSRLMVEVAGGSTAEHAVIQQGPDTGSPAQLWKFCPFQPGLLASDSFDYPPGELSGQGGGEGWNGNWSDMLNPSTRVVTGSLRGAGNTPANYDAESAGQAAWIPTDKRSQRYLDCSPSGNFGTYGYLNASGRIGADGRTLYLSFLQQPAKTCLFYEFELNRDGERIAGIGNDTHTDMVNLRAPATTYTPIGPGDTNVNFYVVRIDFKPGKDDIRIYRNPTSLTEPDQATLYLPAGSDLSFNRLSLAAFANSNSVKFDQIRIAGDWPTAVAAPVKYPPLPGQELGSDDIFRRVRLPAQVLGGSHGKYYLQTGHTGLRLSLARPQGLQPGDLVTVTGLLAHRTQTMELVEAEASVTGHTALPAPAPLNFADPARSNFWVTVEGTLNGVRDIGAEKVLEVQCGTQRLVARFEPQWDLTRNWPVGARLQLTGIFPGPAAFGETEPSLLLNSPGAVQLLARPPWWNLKRAMIAIGLLGLVLALAFIWIRMLHRQVNRQTLRLRAEIRHREAAERARLIEEERSRISRDLHDDLGSSLTQINMLAAAAARSKLPMETLQDRIRLISEKSHRLITALDEVVWMMNSQAESMSSLASYLAAYTEEFLAKTSITCRIETPRTYPAKVVSAEVRNHFFSAAKEALNNAVRHGHPTTITLRLAATEEYFEGVIQDDGCGFEPATAVPGNGLQNLRSRMQQVGGTCHLESAPQQGTSIRLRVPPQ
ncbi:MAG TPA: RICIN domain-containing protein, partial [Verrucomicrobiae bacterium]